MARPTVKDTDFMGKEAYLAQRAVTHLPYEALRDGSWSDGELAAAELRRLGLDRPARPGRLPLAPRERVRS